MRCTNRLVRTFACALLAFPTSGVLADEKPSETKPAPSKPDAVRPGGAKADSEEPIDFDRARRLMRRRQGGERLTADEEAFLRRAMEEFRKRNPGRGPAAPPPPRESTGLKPLTESSADDRYKEQDGGLYGAGKNEPPESHRQAALAEIKKIRPLDGEGNPSSNGRIVFISISMSNATQEFSMFKRLADADEAKSKLVTVVDCAQGGQTMSQWAPPEGRPWGEAAKRIANAGVTAAQVQAVWIKLANAGPSGGLDDYARPLQRDTVAVLQNVKAKYPNVRIAYLSSRIYGGYATTPLNPEPYAYESAFAVRWLIQDQIAEKPGHNYDAARGDVKMPLLLWGPYLWADGTTPRKSDGLVYVREDLAGDGTHPTDAGRRKVAEVMLKFFKTDPLASSWFAPRSSR